MGVERQQGTWYQPSLFEGLEDVRHDASGEGGTGTAAGEEQQRVAEKDNAPVQGQQVTKAMPGSAQDQYAPQLAAAAKLLAAGKKPQAVEAYRKLLRDYPERRKETLASIGDTTVVEKLKAQ